ATKVEPAINMKTAKSLGLTFPLLVLGRADEGDLNNGASCPSWVMGCRCNDVGITSAIRRIAADLLRCAHPLADGQMSVGHPSSGLRAICPQLEVCSGS